MSTHYVISPSQRTVKGCVEQPGTRVRATESGLEILTFSFRGKPSNILDLQYVMRTLNPVLIEGNWQNFRVTETDITENDGVWATLACTAYGLRGTVPPPNVKWSKTLASLDNVTVAGVPYRTAHYLTPRVTIRRCEAIPNGVLTPPQPAPPEFGARAAVEFMTASGLLSAVVGDSLRVCTGFEYEQRGIYWDISESYEVVIPKPGEGTEASYGDGTTGVTIFSTYYGPNYTSAQYITRGN